MGKMRGVIVSSLSGLAVALTGLPAPAQSSCDYAHLPTRFADVVHDARQRVAKGELPSIAIAIAQQGRVVCEEAFGWADREQETPATPSTVYAAGSVAKAVTGAAAFVLAGRGKLRLNESPEYYGVHVGGDGGRAVTLGQLLSMTGGVPHGWFYNYTPDVDAAALLSRYAITAFPPGERFLYSNFSFGIIGAVVARAAQRPFRDVLRDEILGPLHMTSSGFNLAGRDVATGYHAGKAVPPHTFEPEAGGGFYTSAHDLALFGLFQIDPAQSLIAPALMQQMHTVPVDPRFKSRYISGWGVLNFQDGSAALLSDGVVLAGSATLLVLPKVGVVIACLTNTGSEAMDDLAFQLGDVFSSGLMANLDSARKEARATAAARPFRADSSQRGSWAGIAETPNGKIAVRIEITGTDQVQIALGSGAMASVKDPRIEQGLLSGEVAASLELPETHGEPSELTLELEWADANHLVGAARTESTSDLPRFGLPVYLSLTRKQ